jgi:hypothetical protein
MKTGLQTATLAMLAWLGTGCATSVTHLRLWQAFNPASQGLSMPHDQAAWFILGDYACLEALDGYWNPPGSEEGSCMTASFYEFPLSVRQCSAVEVSPGPHTAVFTFVRPCDYQEGRILHQTTLRGEAITKHFDLKDGGIYEVQPELMGGSWFEHPTEWRVTVKEVTDEAACRKWMTLLRKAKQQHRKNGSKPPIFGLYLYSGSKG